MSPRTPRPCALWAALLLEAAGLWLLIVLTGTLLIAGLLDQWRQQELQSMERAQIELTLLELQSELESDLALGLDAQHNLRIQGLMEIRVRKNSQIYSLDVLGPGGRALYSTDRGIVGEPLPPAARAALHEGAARRQPWHALIASTPVMGIGLLNPFGETAGHVTAAYAPLAQGDFTGWMMAAPVLLTLLATALAGAGAVWWATRAQRQLLRTQSGQRLAQVHAQLAATRQRLDEASVRLDAVERFE